ncbi:hypothetical protein FIC_01019 [Flavobacteriaceae bacterium 3519-10]|nr:hypothetical protein FIC_01019 [Flavobacteriaceae bacterium 3519-10]
MATVPEVLEGLEGLDATSPKSPRTITRCLRLSKAGDYGA